MWQLLRFVIDMALKDKIFPLNPHQYQEVGSNLFLTALIHYNPCFRMLTQTLLAYYNRKSIEC
jgi:hypothetical protein